LCFIIRELLQDMFVFHVFVRTLNNVLYVQIVDSVSLNVSFNKMS